MWLVIPLGEHDVRLHDAPTSLCCGMAISALSLVLLAGGCVAAHLRRSR